MRISDWISDVCSSDLLDLTFVTSMQRTRSAEPIDERIDFFFTARAWSGEPRIVEPAKCADLRWCRLDDLPDPGGPHEVRVLQAGRDGGVHIGRAAGGERVCEYAWNSGVAGDLK